MNLHTLPQASIQPKPQLETAQAQHFILALSVQTSVMSTENGPKHWEVAKQMAQDKPRPAVLHLRPSSGSQWPSDMWLFLIITRRFQESL